MSQQRSPLPFGIGCALTAGRPTSRITPSIQLEEVDIPAQTDTCRQRQQEGVDQYRTWHKYRIDRSKDADSEQVQPHANGSLSGSAAEHRQHGYCQTSRPNQIEREICTPDPIP